MRKRGIALGTYLFGKELQVRRALVPTLGLLPLARLLARLLGLLLRRPRHILVGPLVIRTVVVARRIVLIVVLERLLTV